MGTPSSSPAGSTHLCKDPSLLTIALAGNPNIGKSTLFNNLTGLNQHVGNWPGKTVELAVGKSIFEGEKIIIVDLPGTYSLNVNSPEEIIARDYILSDQADVVIVLVDATNLERNLYFVRQTAELTNKIVVALNMMDIVESKGWKIKVKELSEKIGLPVVPISAAKGTGIKELIQLTAAVGKGDITNRPFLNYSENVEKAVGQVKDLVEKLPHQFKGYPKRWLALKLLDEDPDITEKLRQNEQGCLLSLVNEIRIKQGLNFNEIITQEIYSQASQVVRQTLIKKNEEKEDFTEKLDGIITHKVFAFPFMLAVLGAVLWITMFGAEPISAVLELGFARLSLYAGKIFVSLNLPFWLTGSLVDGLLVGVGAVITVMLPTMTIFFILFALLEDSGFIPRIAFNMDRPMQAVGSQGKHCLTCLMGFGCNIPGIMSARIMDGDYRNIAIITNSIIPCNGRLGIMLPLSVLFFGSYGPAVTLMLILISIGAVMLSTLFLSRVIFKRKDAGFVLELPSYRKPQFLKIIIRAMKEKVLHVLVRAALVAAPMTLVIWFLSNYPQGVSFEQTYTGMLVNFFEPAGSLVGLDGQIMTSLLFALPAKEIIIGALAITNGLATSLEGSGIIDGFLLNSWSPLIAFNFLLFFMLYMPCTYTAVIIYKETKSFKWFLWSLLLPLTLAFLFTFISYQTGLFLGLS